MTSQHEDTTVEDLDVANLSDEALRDIAENDSRVTAQEKAQAEINRREANTDDTDDTDTRNLDAVDVKERGFDRPEAPVTDSRGYESSPESEALGAGQMQHDMNLATASGVWPGSGDPPDASHTVEAVTQIPAAANESAPEPGVEES